MRAVFKRLSAGFLALSNRLPPLPGCFPASDRPSVLGIFHPSGVKGTVNAKKERVSPRKKSIKNQALSRRAVNMIGRCNV